MLKRAVSAFLAIFALLLAGCVTPTTGLVPFADSKDGYSFLYPNGWLETKLKDGPDVLFHDLIEPSENVSVAISRLQSVKTLSDIGTTEDVGVRVQERLVAPSGSGREATLLNSDRRDVDGKTYYLLEYAVKRASGEPRHDLVNVTTSRGNLYTLSVSTLDSRWSKMKDVFYRVASSFSVS